MTDDEIRDQIADHQLQAAGLKAMIMHSLMEEQTERARAQQIEWGGKRLNHMAEARRLRKLLKAGAGK